MNKNYKKALDILKAVEHDFNTREERFEKAFDSYNKAASYLSQYSSFGLNFDESNELIRQADSIFEKMNYDEAKRLSDQALMAAESKVGKSMPDIVVDANLNNIFVAGRQRKFEIAIKNRGNVAAKDINIEFDGNIEVNTDIDTISMLGPKDDITVKAVGLFENAGDNQIRITVDAYSKMDNRHIPTYLDEWITVLDPSGKQSSGMAGGFTGVTAENTPEVFLDIIEEEVEYKSWDQVRLRVVNRSDVSIVNIHVEIKGPMDVSTIDPIRVLPAGEEETVTIGLRASEAGRIPAEILTVFFDEQRNRFNYKRQDWITVNKPDKSTETQINIGSLIQDQSTHISDSVIQRSKIGSGGGGVPGAPPPAGGSGGKTTIKGTTMQRSNVAGGGDVEIEDSVMVRSNVGAPPAPEPEKKDDEWLDDIDLDMEGL